jgi:peptidoglycan/xylan/chitin deacetylase (PgdA/CDA1 family)
MLRPCWLLGLFGAVGLLIACDDTATSGRGGTGASAGGGLGGDAGGASTSANSAGGGAGGRPLASPLSLSGVVLDADGAPVANATVALSANPALSDVTAIDGSFELVSEHPTGRPEPPRYPASRPVEHTLVATKSGYLTTYRGVPSAQAAGLPVRLRESIPTTGGGAAPAAPILAQYPGKRRAVVTPTFDDTLPSQLTLARPLFDLYGYKATFYVNTGIIGAAFATSWPMWQAVAGAGHEIGNHGRTHWVWPECTPQAEAHNQLEIAGGYADILAQIGAPPLSFAFPAGGASACSTPLVTSSGHVDWRRADHAQYTDRLYPEGDDLTSAEAIEYVDQAIADTVNWNGAELSWLLFYMHDVTPARAEVLEDLLDYASANDDLVWCTGYGAATLYEREREQSVIQLLQHGPRSVTLRLTNGLDPSTFDVPLTVVVPLPAGTTGIEASAIRCVSASPVEVRVRPGRLLVDVVPSAEAVHLAWQELARQRSDHPGRAEEALGVQARRRLPRERLRGGQGLGQLRREAPRRRRHAAHEVEEARDGLRGVPHRQGRHGA